MDWKSFWDSQRSTIVSALIAIVVIAGLFILFNALPAGQPAKPADEEKQEQSKDSKKSDQEKDKEGEKNGGTTSTKLPAKYTVKSGDSLWKIAKAKYGTGEKWAAIASENKISNPDQIFAGSNITLPKAQDYKVKAGDTLWDIAEHFYGDGFQWTKIRDANPSKTGTLPNGSNLIMTGQIIVVP